MGHDSQVPQEREENSTALSRQPKTCSDVVLNWLRLYAAMPWMVEQKISWDEIILFYSDALGNLSNPLALHKAWDSCRGRIRFLPQVPDLLEAYEIEKGKLLAAESQSRERLELCGDCQGTGWKVTPRTDGQDGRWAVACECRKKKTA